MSAYKVRTKDSKETIGFFSAEDVSALFWMLLAEFVNPGQCEWRRAGKRHWKSFSRRC